MAESTHELESHNLPTREDGNARRAPAPPEAFGRGAKTRDRAAPSNDGSKGAESDDKQKDQDKKPAKKPFWKRPVLLISMIAVAVVLIAGGVIWWLSQRNFESTDDAFIDGHIIHVAPRVPGRVASLNVDDNQLVEADTVVIKIDRAPFEAAYANAKAALEQAQAKVAQAEADLAVQQATAEQNKADVIVAEANASNAESDFRRYLALQPAARSQQQVDASTASQKSTAAQVTAARKKAASAEAQVGAARTGIDAAKAMVAASEAQLRKSALDLQYTDVTAGQEGYVTRRTVEKGNFVQVGQELMTIVPRDVWVTANFKETQLNYLRPKQPVEVEVDAFPQHKYRAHVESIQTGTGAVFSVLPPENATGNYVKIVQRVPVKIVFDEQLDHVLAPGESVDPKVDISSGR